MAEPVTGPNDDDVVLDDEDVRRALGPIALFIRRVILIGVLPIFSSLYLWQALVIEVPGRDLVVSPRAFPTLIAVLMVAVSLTIAGLEVRKALLGRRTVTEAIPVITEGMDDDDGERISSWRDTWITLGAFTLYVILFPMLGFIVATVAFVFGLSSYLQRGKLLRNAIVAVIFPVLIYLVFTELLGVRLPAGILEGVLG